MPINIYPPILQSTQSAFLASTTNYKVYFTLQSITDFSDIGHIQIRLVKQANNKSIVDTNQYPDGIIYKSVSSIQNDGNSYYILINNGELAEKWTGGYLYKIQIRFGTNAMYQSLSEFATWKSNSIQNNYFSEWSTVMVVKSIDKPNVYIKNAETDIDETDEIEKIEATLMPTFFGVYEIAANNKEIQDSYKFDLYNGQQETLIESSGWLLHNVSNSMDEHVFKTVLEEDEPYTVVYTIQTINGYVQESLPYYFSASQVYFGDLTGVSFDVVDSTPYCQDNGCIQLYLTSVSELTGTYIIIRTSEASNYSKWDDLYEFTTSITKFTNSLIYTDFTIESGMRYKYAIQQKNSKGLRTTPVYEQNNIAHKIDLDYAYLYRDGVQLKLEYNQTISSFKHTTLRTKQDTLGGRYPYLLENGDAYYAEFSLNGLITIQMDEDSTFFTKKNNGYYYKDELVLPKDKLSWDYAFRDNYVALDTSVSTDLTHENYYIERLFREKVEGFLNDFSYLLYRSPTEGNIIISLMNVSLSPEAQLGRLIYSFSSIAYEMLENTLDNLKSSGILSSTSDSEDNILATTQTSFGQISGVFNQNEDLYSLIKQQEERQVGEEFQLVLDTITDLSIEYYPDIDLSLELSNLQQQRAELAANGEETTEIESQIAELEELIQALGNTATTFIVSINGTNVIIQTNTIYHSTQNVNSLTMVSGGIPAIINYECIMRLEQVENTLAGNSSIATSSFWNQLSGLFTLEDNVLETYDFEYANSETFRIYNPEPDSTVIFDAMGDVLVDNTNYNVYKEQDLYKIIKEDTKKQVELAYGTEFTENEEGWVTDGEIYYFFQGISYLDIEADEGTILKIGKNEDGSNATEIRIGPTGRYVYDSAQDLIRYLCLTQPSYCVINYRSTTIQIKMGALGNV